MTMETKKDVSQEYFSRDEAGEYLQVDGRKIDSFRKAGLLRYGRLGRNYIYRKCWLDDFMEEWAGYDLSSDENIKLSIQARNWRNTHNV